MPSESYETDALAWSEQQADKLRRIARGERVNDADWLNIIEEIESVGLSELRACRGVLRHALLHLLKLRGWPQNDAAGHWQSEARVFLTDARRAFAPSMRQRLDLPELYRDALDMTTTDRIGGQPPARLRPECPFTLDDLLGSPPDITELVARLGEAPD